MVAAHQSGQHQGGMNDPPGKRSEPGTNLTTGDVLKSGRYRG
jgi:hypothetical protein